MSIPNEDHLPTRFIAAHGNLLKALAKILDEQVETENRLWRQTYEIIARAGGIRSDWKRP